MSAHAEDAKSSLRVCLILDDPEMDSYYRIVQPYRAIAGIPGVEARLAASCADEHAEWADVLVVHGWIDADVYAFLRRARTLCRRVILDVDEWVDLPPYDPRYGMYSNLRPFPQLALSEVDGLSVASERLGTQMAPYNDVLAVIPSWVPPVRPDSANRERLRAELGVPPDGVVLGWFGAPWEQHGLRQIAGALERVACSRRNVYVIAPGVAADMFFVPEDRRLPGEPLRFTQYAAMLDMIDVGIGTLETTLYDGCRPDSALLHHGAYSVPYVTSDFGAMADAVAAGAPIACAKDADEWEEALLRLVDDPSSRRESGDSLHDWVMRERGAADGVERFMSFITGEARTWIRSGADD